MTHRPATSLRQIGGIVLLLLSFSLPIRAEWLLIDKFADGDLSSAPAWGGDTTNFTVVDSSAGPAGGVQGMRLAVPDGSPAGTQSLTVTNAHGGLIQEWAWWWGRRAQAASSANHMRFWVYANAADVEAGTTDGYVVHFNGATDPDKLIFQRIDNGSVANLATGTVDIVNGMTDIGFCLRVTYSNGTWRLYTSDLPTANGTGFNNTADPRYVATNLQCSAVDSTYTPSGGYVGFECVHSSGADGRAGAELDQVYYKGSNVVETIAFQSFDEGFYGWNFTTNPAAYIDGTDRWQPATNLANNVEQSADGTLFWGMDHQTNASFHTLRFEPVDVSGYTNVQLSFQYWTDDYEASDVLRYSVMYDLGSTWNGYVTNSRDTDAWTPITVDVPSTAVVVRLSLESKQAADYAGWDAVRLTGIAAANISVLGTNGVEIATGNVSPNFASGTHFSNALVASGTIDHTFTVTNCGSDRLYLTADPAVALVGHAPDFSLQTPPASTNLAPSEGTGFTIRFAPSASGLRTAMVSILNSDLNESPYTFRIAGTGVYNTNSDIIANGGTVANIEYHSYQEDTDLTSGNSLSIFRFRIRDGGLAANDADSVGTELTNITFSIGNAGYLRRVGLYDGSTEIAEQAVSGGTVAFSGLSGANVTAADNGYKLLTLQASFTTNVTDNERITVDIAAAGASGSGSGFALADAGGAQSDRTGTDNQIEVTATKLVLTSVPTRVLINSNFTAVVQAQDANGVRDLDSSVFVAVARSGGAGTVSGGDGQALASGRQEWSALQIDTSGTFTLTATNGALTAAVSDAINAHVLFQGFESGAHENWNYVENPGSAIDTSTNKAAAGTNSLQLTGTSTAVFDNVSLLTYKDASVSIAFAADGPDATGDEDLYAELSYDGGTTWPESIRLIDGYSPTLIEFGETNASNPTTVSPNPYTIVIVNTAQQVRVRARVNNLDAGEYYYVDNVAFNGSIRDIDSTVQAPAEQIPAGVISSVASVPIEVFAFKITDTGNNDGDATQVTTLTIKPGAANTADWTDTIQDVLLKHGTTNIVVDAVAISDSAIVITVDVGNLAVPDGAGQEFKMLIRLNSANVADNSRLQFLIDGDAHGFVADYATGSGLKDDFGVDVQSGNWLVAVWATRLAFAPARPPTVVGLATDFSVEVRGVDANGNRDTNATHAVSLYKASGNGTLSSAGPGLSNIALTDGTRLWTDVQMNAPGTFTILASNAVLGTVISEEIVAGGVWINEVDYDNPGANTNGWVEFAGTAGLTLDDYNLVLIDSDGQTYASWDLSAAGLAFSDEHNGFGFLTWGIVPPAQGTADYTPPIGWTSDEIQVGPNDTVQLRKKDGSNSHLLDYEGNNTHTAEDQATPVADNNSDTNTSIYLTGGPGSWFSAFSWTNKQYLSTPGAVNEGQLLNTPTNAPALSNGKGASAIGPSGALLNGAVLAGYPFPRVYVCWATNRAGPSTSAWDNVIDMGIRYWGEFSANISSLATNTTYYYRCYATNVDGVVWTPVTNFMTTAIMPVPPDYAIYIDDIGIASAAPACIDRDGNGLSDSWEQEYLGDIGNEPYADADGDGVSNLWEYIAGTDPDDETSSMRAIALDLETAGSSNLVLRWTTGTHDFDTPYRQAGDRIARDLGILAADNNAALAKSRVATLGQDPSGTNAWTDVNAVNRFTSRYYALSASLGGMGYTNNEEWAMHVQSRLDACKYLVSVPVNLSPDNNLNSTAGMQLGRGLFAGENSVDSDRIFYRTPTNTWQEYYLVTNASGEALWWDYDAGAQADLAITPGMGFWVERRSGTPRTRETCVFAGPSHVTAPTITISTNDNVGGWTWNIFGWPFAKRKRHRNLGVGDTPANQLGFATAGYGGTTAQVTKPHEAMGDQIWTWETNRFTRYYWLMDGLGANLDGRWQDRFTGEFADFSLVPGRAYFYRHHVGTNGTGTGVEFEWQPVAP
jgi:hypothetical protein